MDEIPRDALIVCGEQVNCPLRRTDSDIEACWRCPWLRRTGGTAQARYVQCAPPFASLPPQGVGPSPA